jgi:hypothetical protein
MMLAVLVCGAFNEVHIWKTHGCMINLNIPGTTTAMVL